MDVHEHLAHGLAYHCDVEGCLKVGDLVVITDDVWDNARRASWKNWKGVIRNIYDMSEFGGPGIAYYVEFPHARGRFRSYDFSANELAKIGD